ncbi:MAG: ComF family protein [Chitinophagales bacterium]|nr:ComF family protein [Chitinophagales bacterium]
MLTIARQYLTDFFNLFYPNICLTCSNALLKGEMVLCFRCENELPQTDHCFEAENKLVKRFWGRVPLQGAVALYHFTKGGAIQHLLHSLKYKGRKDAGEYCGKLLGRKLRQPNSIIKNVDLIVPVPLHWKKQQLRGYNQCEPFAKALADTINVPYSFTALQRTHENVSQTRKTRFDRWGNVAEIFSVKDTAQLQGKHILLVDDVVTTGATAEACIQTILQVPNTKVSFAAIAAAAR